MKSSVVKMMDPSIAASIRQPVPSGSLEAQTQPFQGSAPASVPISSAKKKAAEKSEENPLLSPSIAKKERASVVAQSLPAAPVAAMAAESKSVRRAPSDRTPNMITQDAERRTLAPDVMAELDKVSRLFAEYKMEQFQTETANPYLTDSVIYTPQTSRSFYRFVDDNYAQDFRLVDKLVGKSDPEACNKLQTKTDGKTEAFVYQQFIREYIRTASPYRGILVYHGLGSGKTCSSIAAAEALYGTGNKKIIVMTPFSLRGNFISEVSFCGFRHYSMYNHWVAQPMDSVGSVTYLFARSVLSLPDDYLRRVIRRPDPEQRRIWLPDYSKPANYADLAPEDKNEIRTQITAMIESRIIFINYNGVGPKTLMRYACEKDADGNRLFDNAVIVIDEFHNLTRLMHGNIFQYITERKGRARTIPAEPIVPGKWEPKLCGSQLAYSRGFLYYRLLSDARNSKIIGLTGTPIINFPEELGILSNVLAGYIECVEFEIRETDTARLEKVRRLAEQEPRVDMVRFQRENLKTKVLISTFLEGYEQAPIVVPMAAGVRYNADAQDSIRVVFPRIREKLTKAGIQVIGAETYVSYPRLPVDEDTFRANFVNEADLSIKNKVTLQKRLTGLISYYKGANEDYMPRVKKDVLVECMLSDYALKVYTDARKWEMDIESSKQKEPTDIYATVEMFAKMGNSSNYRSRSRAICNFAFPEAIQRPYPGSKADEKAAAKVELTGIQEDADVTEATYEELSDEDKAAIAQAQQEEMMVEKSVEDVGEEKQAGGSDPMENFMKQFQSMSTRMQDIQQPISNIERFPASENEPEIVYRRAEEEEEEEDEEEDESNTSSVSSSSSTKSNTSSVSSSSSTKSNTSSVSSTSSAKSNASSVSSEEEEEENASSLASVRSEEEEASNASSVSSASSSNSEEEENELDAALKNVNVKESAFNASKYKILTTDNLAAQMAALSAQMAKPNQPLTLAAEPQTAASAASSQNVPQTTASAASSSQNVPVSAPKPPRRKMPVFLENTPPPPPPIEEKKEAARAPRRKMPVFIEETPAPLQQVPQAVDIKSAEAVGKSMTLAEKKRALAEKLRKQKEARESGKEELVVSNYVTQLQAAMTKLENHRNDFLNLEDPIEEKRLANYSAKLYHMLNHLNESKGSNLVYSQFKMVEGLGVLALALRANGYVEIKIEGSDDNPRFSPETEESLRKGPDAKEKRFIMFTGDGSKERRTLILNIFNGNFDKLPQNISKVLKESGYEANANLYGDICWVIGITGAGAEGISLKCCRSVHIMEPYWNNVRLDQVKGRAIRICSHKDLPYEEREVEIYTYCTVFTKEQLSTGKIDLSLIQTDKGETSDQKVYNVSKLKDTINQGILQVMKEAAVDCDLNAADNDGVRCFRVEEKRAGAKVAPDRPDMYLFDPNLTIDIAVTNMYFKDVEESYPTTAEEKKEQAMTSVLSSSASAAAPPPKASEESIDILVITIRGKEYYVAPSRDSPDTTYEIFERTDRRLSKPIGVAYVNPAAAAGTIAFSGFEFTNPAYMQLIGSAQ